MALSTRALVDSVLITIGYTMMYLYLDGKGGDLTSNYPWAFIILGLVILHFRTKISEAIPFKFVNKFIIDTAGYIVIFLGLRNYLVNYLDTFGIMYLVLGAIIYNYHKSISEKIVPDHLKV